jgi:hypothetical protein
MAIVATGVKIIIIIIKKKTHLFICIIVFCNENTDFSQLDFFIDVSILD